MIIHNIKRYGITGKTICRFYSRSIFVWSLLGPTGAKVGGVIGGIGNILFNVISMNK